MIYVLILCVAIIVVLIQFYVHEVGHWLVAKLLGHPALIKVKLGSSIQFHTYIFNKEKFTRRKDFAITIAGPFFQTIVWILIEEIFKFEGVGISLFVYLPFILQPLIPLKALETDGSYILELMTFLPFEKLIHRFCLVVWCGLLMSSFVSTFLQLWYNPWANHSLWILDFEILGFLINLPYVFILIALMKRRITIRE
nr:hypothetical protein [Bacilli bacterium]